MLATRLDLVGDRGCALLETVTWVGEDFTSADVTMQVREIRDGTGSPLIDLSLSSGLAWSYVGTATVASHIAAGRLTGEIYQMINPATGVAYVNADSVALSVLLIGIAAATMGGLPYPGERGDDYVGAYDVVIDVDGGGPQDPQKLVYGEFRVRGTVTQ